METESAARPAGRPRPGLLVALAVAVGLALISWLTPGKSAAPIGRPSNARAQTAKKGVEAINPADLDVRLEALKTPRPESEASDRNPFRFYVKPAPPPRPVDPGPIGPPPSGPGTGAGPIVPALPRIPLKFIGVIEAPGGEKIAAFSDCRMTMHGREGEIVAGQYRLVHIGVESVVMEYADGRGRETIRMSGQECVGK